MEKSGPAECLYLVRKGFWRSLGRLTVSNDGNYSGVSNCSTGEGPAIVLLCVLKLILIYRRERYRVPDQRSSK